MTLYCKRKLLNLLLKRPSRFLIFFHDIFKHVFGNLNILCENVTHVDIWVLPCVEKSPYCEEPVTIQDQLVNKMLSASTWLLLGTGLTLVQASYIAASPGLSAVFIREMLDRMGSDLADPGRGDYIDIIPQTYVKTILFLIT
ncbi:hypothetical protein SK128_014430 [Halocaridina rubra]|uniref:Uncharacterized protein n=1 Tax=Halocaridina rubra TaxID=373956 RepID=A0AAN9A4R0_HALRR